MSSRVGAVAQKLGMTTYYDKDTGEQVPVTLLSINDNNVIGFKSEVGKDGYNAVVIGAVNTKKTKKSLAGKFNKAGVSFKRFVREFRVSVVSDLKVGDEIKASYYVAGQYIDVQAVSKGKGFAGAMKRHNFGGLEASHGVSINHRSVGSTGQCQDPGRVFKGKKMPGQMGNVKVTIKNLKVLLVDHDKGIVYVKGSLPGYTGAYVTIKDSLKKNRADNSES